MKTARVREKIKYICGVLHLGVSGDNDIEIGKERQLGKEKHHLDPFSQVVYSAGFMDAINWIKRVVTKTDKP